jgi:murein DD-endopeptidase MepM/ murein hydrolase activator NlpD
MLGWYGVNGASGLGPDPVRPNRRPAGTMCGTREAAPFDGPIYLSEQLTGRCSLSGRGNLRLFLILLALCTFPVRLGAAAAPASRVANPWSVRWQPWRVVNGGAVAIRIVPPVALESLSGSWVGHDVFFSFDPRSQTWYGIAGVSLETKAGAYPLQLTGSTKGGRKISFERKLTVQRAKYPSIAVTVARQYTEPSAEQLQRIDRDKVLKQEVFRRVDADRQWAGSFSPPVDARISDVFGTRRIFNGKAQSTHQGLDYAVPPGTPVSAVNAGTVLLARPLFFEGNCIVLDHGQGLLTLYLHLSDFKVKEGDHVARGQEIGLSGGSGRATGPHLHVAVRWQGVYMDPATLLKLRFP